jgi:anti-sigma-K factor RskA
MAVSTSPQPNPATVEALLETTWHLTASEAARTEALDRKSATLATFASLLTALTATPEQVRGETMRGLVEAIARERAANDGKARLVRWAYLALAAALVLTIAEAVTLGLNEVS